MRANLPTIRSLGEATAILNGREERKIGHNTWLRESGMNCISVYHHQTEIVAFLPHCIYFPSHSWRSRATKDRLNHFLAPFGLKIVQQDFRWLLTKPGFASVHCLDFSIWPKEGVLHIGLPSVEDVQSNTEFRSFPRTSPWLHLPEVS